MVAWGLDDYFIEKSTRKLGDTATLFFVTTFGTLVLLPFVWAEVTSPELWSLSRELWILLIATLVTLCAALADYEALRVGKLSIVEPVYALEVPVTVILGLVIIQERLTGVQLGLIFILTTGIFLVSTKSLVSLKRLSWERGVRLALLSAALMGATNFLTGYSGRLTSPLLANWFIYAGLAAAMFIYLLYTKKLTAIAQGLQAHPRIILAVSVADLIAWTSFTYSAFYIPIALATAISESYIALAVLLGLYLNKERLKRHQLLGITITLLAVITLSLTS